MLADEPRPVESFLMCMIDEFISGKRTYIRCSTDVSKKEIKINTVAFTKPMKTDYFSSRGISLFKMLMQAAIDKQLSTFYKDEWGHLTFTCTDISVIEKIDKFRKNV